MTLAAAVFAAVVLYAVPFAVFVLARGAPGAQPVRSWQLGVELPAVFAADLLSILVISWVLPLDWAVFTSRALWLAAAAALAIRRRLAWPSCLDARVSAIVAIAAFLGARASLVLSRDWTLWDRRWHMPLVTAMEGERLPFQNVFEPGRTLHYHFSGDVHAAMFRALSWAHMSSSLALSLSHDVVYAVIGGVTALLLVERAKPAFALVAFAVGGMLLHGPVVQQSGKGFQFSGHMYQVFLSVGFRPHLPISGLVTIGLVAAACAAATSGAGAPQGTRALAARMLPAASLLSISDETSTAIVLASLGAAWLVDTRIFGRTWWHGAALLASLGVVAAATNLAFQASLAPGGPVQKLEIVPARIAELRAATQPLWTAVGVTALGYDLFPFAVPALGVLLYAAQARSRRLLALAVTALAATALTAVLATKARINGQDGVEAERFFIAVFFVVLTIAFWLLPAMRRWSIASALVVLGPAASIFFTYWWFRAAAPEALSGSEATHPLLTKNLYEVDCRADADARLGDRPVVTYVDEKSWYFYTSCRGVFEAGLTDPPWPVKIRPAFEVPSHLAEFAKLADPEATVPAVCRNDGQNDPVCRELVKAGGCAPDGADFVACPFPATLRRKLLGGR
jgi:hypothetical protein